jgi:single-strand DNA-binding protein
MAGDINRVTLVGRLTRDPELRHLPSGQPVLQLGLAVNGRQRDDGGNWVDKPNFFDIKVFGNQAEMLSQHLAKGRRVGIDGRLDWSSWEAQDGTKRSKVEVVAFQVQFLDSRGEAEGGNQYIPSSDVSADQSDFVRAGSGSGADDDIPF